ncbi:FCD domain-containing protein [Streptomyces rubradiris]|uniref:GntR C-terminal domain-containing protein n=1 Tax=Streptomyces rubradiris TaxID=285531 RepID=A0ABQ3R9G5_STRRR|nr:FCD domain-containing protein [Streptomyces rubradiris]GHH00008.1 hypothetical protein GCM10018792_13960 [Streptomyces rubradiris]GHI52495.1 hypothetical protein Srubr_23410 [Streptomyces rubradiris]
MPRAPDGRPGTPPLAPAVPEGTNAPGDAAFHRTVVAATGNETLTSLLEGSSSRTIRARVWRGVLEGDASHITLAEHEAIYNALRARDQSLAQSSGVLHVDTSEVGPRSVLTGSSEPDNGQGPAPARHTGRAGTTRCTRQRPGKNLPAAGERPKSRTSGGRCPRGRPRRPPLRQPADLRLPVPRPAPHRMPQERLTQ